jgi:hypothetical protein
MSRTLGHLYWVGWLESDETKRVVHICVRMYLSFSLYYLHIYVFFMFVAFSLYYLHVHSLGFKLRPPQC